MYGVAKSDRPLVSRARVRTLEDAFEIVAFDAPAADAYGDVRAALERIGRPIGPLDTLIAAHALSLGTTLVTNNVREFRRVGGLAVEDWSS